MENATTDTAPGDMADMEVDMDMSDAPMDSPEPNLKSGHVPADSSIERESSSLLPSADISSLKSNSLQSIPVYRQVKTEPKPPQPTPLLTQTHAIVMPSYAAWFSLTKIHEVEKRSLPEFFNQRNRSKTPDIYMKYRNFMVNTYRLNPAEYLTVTACRRNLIGDVCTIMRVHNFLDKWGMINYQVDVEALPANVVPPFTGHWNVLHDTPRGLFPFKFYKGQDDPSANTLPGGKTMEEATAAASANATGTSAAPAAAATMPTTASNSNTPTVDTNSKPTKEEVAPIDPGFGWTKKELLLLLEGVERFSGDWSAIAEHVITKDRQACIIRFLSLSIEDRYLDNKSNGSTNGSAYGVKTEDGPDRLGPLKYDTSNVPFSQADNPVMSVVSFLAELVDPKVVAAAANRSIKAMKEIVEGRPDAEANEESNGESSKEKPSENKEPAANMSDTFLEDVSTVAFGALGARSEVIRTQTARQMYASLFKLVSQQLAKNESKISKFSQLENVLEIERRELEKEREEMFLDRLALHKKVRNVDELLSRALQQTQSGADVGLVKSTLEEASRVVSDGTKLTLNSNLLFGSAIAVPEETGEESLANGNSKLDVQPVSVELPQTYKFWSI